MDHDIDVVRVVEGGCTARKRRVIEVPLRRSRLPDKLRELAPVFLVAGPAALSGEIELVPKIKFGLRRGRQLAGFLIADR